MYLEIKFAYNLISSCYWCDLKIWSSLYLIVWLSEITKAKPSENNPFQCDVLHILNIPHNTLISKKNTHDSHYHLPSVSYHPTRVVASLSDLQKIDWNIQMFMMKRWCQCFIPTQIKEEEHPIVMTAQHDRSSLYTETNSFSPKCTLNFVYKFH